MNTIKIFLPVSRSWRWQLYSSLFFKPEGRGRHHLFITTHSLTFSSQFFVLFLKKGYLGEKIYLLLSNGKNKPTNQLFILPIGKESNTCLGFCLFSGVFWSSYWKLLGKKSYYWLLIITCCNGWGHCSRKFYSTW